MGLEKKELWVRSLTGMVIVGSIVGFALWGKVPTFLLFGVVMMVGVSECLKLTQKMGKPVEVLWSYMGSLVLYVGVGLSLILGYEKWTFSWVGLVCALVWITALFSKKNRPIERALWTFWPIVYVTFPLSLLVFFQQEQMLLPLFVFIWANDVFAFLVGSLIGKHKMFPRWSPSKSWEGATGGVLMTLAAAWLWTKIMPDYGAVQLMCVAGVVSLSSILGDLVESMAKREAEVKDSGTLLPGHGGILDRFDSVLIASPMLYFVWVVYANSVV